MRSGGTTKKSAVSDQTSHTEGGKTEQLNPDQRMAFRRAVLEWFDEHRRQLPWRSIADPYATWVSEVMLQQTRVETVVDYFRRWMERFPDVEALADADIEEVLELWSGLGYYRRARYLHRAAKTVVGELGGRLPERVEKLKELPGIGPYTAGAVASIAFGKRAPLVDGNVERVIARLFAIEGDPKRAAAREAIWSAAERLVDEERPGDFNQGMMELGSEVCTASNPGCVSCPVRRWCRGLASGDPHRYPESSRGPNQEPMRARSCVVYAGDKNNGKLLLRRRPEEGLLGGLWEIPSVEQQGKSWPDVETLIERIGSAIPDEKVVDVDGVDAVVATVEHVFSHRRLKTRVHELGVGEQVCDQPVSDRWRWVEVDDVDSVASAALMDKVVAAWLPHR